MKIGMDVTLVGGTCDPGTGKEGSVVSVLSALAVFSFMVIFTDFSLLSFDAVCSSCGGFSAVFCEGREIGKVMC